MDEQIVDEYMRWLDEQIKQSADKRDRVAMFVDTEQAVAYYTGEWTAFKAARDELQAMRDKASAGHDAP